MIIDQALGILMSDGPVGASLVALALLYWWTISNQYKREDKLRADMSFEITSLRRDLVKANDARVEDTQKTIVTLMQIQEESLSAQNRLSRAVADLATAVARLEDK
jgi:hypothetical protein